MHAVDEERSHRALNASPSIGSEVTLLSVKGSSTTTPAGSSASGTTTLQNQATVSPLEEYVTNTLRERNAKAESNCLSAMEPMHSKMMASDKYEILEKSSHDQSKLL